MTGRPHSDSVGTPKLPIVCVLPAGWLAVHRGITSVEGVVSAVSAKLQLEGKEEGRALAADLLRGLGALNYLLILDNVDDVLHQEGPRFRCRRGVVRVAVSLL